MIEVPWRRAFGTSDDYAGALALALAELQVAYEAEPVRAVDPPWPGFHVALPTAIARTPQGSRALLRSLLLGLKTQAVQLRRIARVERNGMTFLWADTNG